MVLNIVRIAVGLSLFVTFASPSLLVENGIRDETLVMQVGLLGLAALCVSFVIWAVLEIRRVPP